MMYPFIPRKVTKLLIKYKQIVDRKIATVPGNDG